MKNKLLLAALAVMTLAGTGSAAKADDDDHYWRHNYHQWGYPGAYVEAAPAYGYGYGYGYGAPIYVNRHERRWIRHHEYEGFRPYRNW